ncbi:MAG: hypothetical protein IAE85_19640 [Anaerolinea sp.]|nr:hypothetical protein [Anaerolinea sp.]
MPEPAQRGPFLVLGTDWPPRQSDAAGQVWRTLPAGERAGLEIVDPDGGPLRLAVEAAASDGGALRLLDDAGRELAAWLLTPERAALSSDLASLPASVHLEYQGSAGAAAVIYRLALE